jgi:hypothetical protein
MLTDFTVVQFTSAGSLKVWNKSGQVYPNNKIESTAGKSAIQHIIRSAAYIVAIDAVCLVTGEDNILFYRREGLHLYKQVNHMIFKHVEFIGVNVKCTNND